MSAPAPPDLEHVQYQAERVRALAQLLHDVQAEQIQCRSKDQREWLQYILPEVLEEECSDLLRLIHEEQKKKAMGTAVA